jgi:hypothetical protein
MYYPGQTYKVFAGDVERPIVPDGHRFSPKSAVENLIGLDSPAG